MRIAAPIIVIAVVSASSGWLYAQEEKPVPKDSMRVSIPGCTKGYIFTVGRRTEDEPGNVDAPIGLHMRMNVPKKAMNEIKAHEGSMIMLTGLVKKDQFRPDGVGIGGGVRITPGAASTGGGGGGVMVGGGVGQYFIDVEGWRQINGSCPSR
jgi:hypothetical protein